MKDTTFYGLFMLDAVPMRIRLFSMRIESLLKVAGTLLIFIVMVRSFN